MARGQSQGISDQSIAAESEIGQMVQQGKLAGLQGMASTEGTSSSGGSSGGGGGDGDGTESALVPEPEKKKGFWGKVGGALKKVGQIALPIAISSFTGGLTAPLTAGLTGAGQNIGKSIAGGLKLPK
jgi:hypothetical protein